ncbi:pilin [Patescibacteria group bacterium]|nr:pilin [Patescibacteria group bacterium]MBU1472187.1 pilin [Patescibacteria group bacterium]MBU2459581.1 pilin [Patescibacteria group bacterium]MBU2544178.1 pilin [Patescibacteria group bacterium]
MKLIPEVFAQAKIEIKQPPQFRVSEIGQLISAVVGTLMILAALIAFLYLIMGGISWITSGGDKANMETARNKITHAIVGLIIVGAAWAIMTLVQNFLGVNIIGSGGITLPQPY